MRIFPRYRGLVAESTGFVKMLFRDYSPTAVATDLELVIDPVDAEVMYHDLEAYEKDAPIHYEDAGEWKNHQPPFPKTIWSHGPAYSSPMKLDTGNDHPHQEQGS